MKKWIERDFDHNALIFCEAGQFPIKFGKYAKSSLDELAFRYALKWENGEIERNTLLLEVYNGLSMTPD